KLSFNERRVEITNTSLKMNDQLWLIDAHYQTEFDFKVSQKDLGLTVQGELKLLPEEHIRFIGNIEMDLLREDIKAESKLESLESFNLVGTIHVEPKEQELKKNLKKARSAFTFSSQEDQLQFAFNDLTLDLNLKPLE